MSEANKEPQINWSSIDNGYVAYVLDEEGDSLDLFIYVLLYALCKMVNPA